jgi:hypothetical protein
MTKKNQPQKWYYKSIKRIMKIVGIIFMSRNKPVINLQVPNYLGINFALILPTSSFPMDFQLNQTVIILDTEHKPAGYAVIRSHSDDLQQYEVDYKYPNSEKTEQIWIPVERLINS